LGSAPCATHPLKEGKTIMPHGAPRALRLPLLCRSALFASATALLTWAPQAQAKVTKILVDRQQALAADTTYETITGRAVGELDPNDPHNVLITDIKHAPPNPKTGKVEYVASFFLVKPVDMSRASGLMWHDVPNRGGRITITPDLRNLNDVGLSSGWQGDNAGANPVTAPATIVPANASTLAPVTPSSNEWVKVPVLTGVTGHIVGRIINRSGLGAQPLNVMGNPIPYFPVDPTNNAGATLTTH